jgi:magnesium transporter
MSAMTPEADRLLARALAESHPADAARILERFAPAEAAALLDEWDAGRAGGTLEQMASASGAACLARMSARAASEALLALDLDSAAALLRGAPPELRTALVERLDPARADPLRLVLSSPAGSAGGLLDPLVLALPRDWSAGQALAAVHDATRRALDYLYVVERGGRLVGVTRVRDLVKAPPDDWIETIMRSPVLRLHAEEDIAAILAHPGWNEFHALPVVDRDDRFLGAIRFETLRRLETEGRGRQGTEAVSVAVSLGELYWIGLCGLLEGLGAVALRGAPFRRSDER